MPLVSIFCITYNHANFIRDAIEGFLMQETTFPVEIFIHDDASTDGTVEIVKQYSEKFPGLFRTVFQTENQWSRGNKKILFDYLAKQRGAFIALCEGDDYWTNVHKLQKQVKTLELNKDSALCFHNAVMLQEGAEISNTSVMHQNLGRDVFETKDLLGPWFIPTASILYRRYQHFSMPNWLYGCQSGDIPLLLLLSLEGNLRYLPDVMSVYRLHAGGMHKTHIGHHKVLSMTYIYQSFNLHTERRFEPFINKAILYEIQRHMPECQVQSEPHGISMGIRVACRGIRTVLYLLIHRFIHYIKKTTLQN